MKKLFPGHYLSSASFQDALPDALVVFDTNVLLNFYEFGPITRERSFSALEKIKKQCWLPYHVALEFHRNRTGRVEKALQNYQTAITDLTTGVATLTSGLEKQDILKHDSTAERLIAAFKEAGAALAKHAQEATNQLPKRSSEDPVNEALAAIFDGRVGQPPTQQIIDEIIKEGRVRVDHKHPPSITDQKKAGEKFLDRGIAYAGEFGDLYIWKQVLEHVKEIKDKRYLVFVTDERKPDWWAKEGSNTILGPSPALAQELALFAPGWNLRMYSSVWFFEQLSDTVGVKLSNEDLEDIRDAASSFERQTLLNMERDLGRTAKGKNWSRYARMTATLAMRVRAYEQWATHLARTSEPDCSIETRIQPPRLFIWQRVNDAPPQLTLVHILDEPQELSFEELQGQVTSTLRRTLTLDVSCKVVFDTTGLSSETRVGLESYFVLDYSPLHWPTIQDVYLAEVVGADVKAIMVA